jgi:hypothetical protein
LLQTSHDDVPILLDGFWMVGTMVFGQKFRTKTSGNPARNSRPSATLQGHSQGISNPARLKGGTVQGAGLLSQLQNHIALSVDRKGAMMT